MNDRLRVLLLEDSRFDAELLGASLLGAYPQAALEVVRDDEAFDAALARGGWDVILSDYQLPGFTGAQALDRAREAAPHTPFIFVSGVIGEDNAVDMLKRGATDYVSKSRMSRLPVVMERALREVAERLQVQRARQALVTAKEEAERANRVKDRFLAVLSHELRTPLSPIAAAAHLLDQDPDFPTRHKGLLAMIRRNVALEARLIDDLLDLTAISTGKLSLKLSPLDMHDLIRNVVAMVLEQADERGIQISVNLSAPQASVLADEARMQQVLWNLLRNAIKFSPQGGTVELESSNRGGRFSLQVVDHGIGIDADALPRIFDAFVQADDEVSQRFGGLGLGLAIAHGLVSQHGGELVAHSDGAGKGSAFTMTVPLNITQSAIASAPPPDLARPPAPALLKVSDESSPVTRLLLVEDNIDAAETMALCLEEYGYGVTHAATCAKALRLASSDDFDVVLTDVGLPDGSGVDVARALGERLPVVALSGYGAELDIKRSSQAGFAGYLVKPADPEAVHAMLRKVIANRRVGVVSG